MSWGRPDKGRREITMASARFRRLHLELIFICFVVVTVVSRWWILNMAVVSEEALLNGQSRMVASVLTWPVEKSKLLYQGGSRAVLRDLTSLRTGHHLMGMASSAAQRGGSAFFMFQIQGLVYPLASRGLTPSLHVDQAMAGALAGSIAAPLHAYWELIKVRGSFPSSRAYWISLRPMLARHSVFDGAFFGVNSCCVAASEDGDRRQRRYPHFNHAGFRFALAAASASFANLVFDVWKTRQMREFPTVVPLRSVMAGMTVGSYARNYLLKGADLTVNWFAVGCIKEALFGDK